MLAGSAPSIGLYAGALGVAPGAGRVRDADADADEQRCEQARALGAEVVLREGDWPRRCDRAAVVVDGTAGAAGSPADGRLELLAGAPGHLLQGPAVAVGVAERRVAHASPDVLQLAHLDAP